MVHAVRPTTILRCANGLVRLTTCLALLAALTRTAHAQPPTPALDTTALLTAFHAEMRALHAPGAALAVVVGDRIVFERGEGVASVEDGVAVTPETLFRIGSTTKMFTGLTALRLAADGRLRLDQPVGDYARGLAPSIGRLTLHQLLTHSAGLANEGAGNGPHDDAALGQRVRGWGAELFFAEPGAIYSYSTPGYWLAGYAIEQAAGGWYADVVDSLVLQPVGMVRSGFRPLGAFTHPVALDHRVGTDGRATVVRPFPDDATTWASGSLFSSAHELGRFLVALLNDGRIDGRQVIPAEAVRALREPRVPIPGTDCSYAYGLQLCDEGGVRVVSHAGFRGGTGSIVSFVPERRVGVAVLSNRNGGIMGRTERRALALLAGLASEPEPEASAKRRFDAATRARLAGVYVNGPDTLHLLDRGDSLVYRYGGAEHPTRPGSSDGEILVLGTSGEPEQRFVALPVQGGPVQYLHDGLSAFRRQRR
jgi:CubicO group peptidase (beta-lactamase class C family)